MRSGGACVLLFLSACSPPPTPCDWTNCHGCCDMRGVCLPGFELNHCGINGSDCVDCGASRSCIAGACVSMSSGGGTASSGGGAGGGGGGFGGGSAQGGGSGIRHIEDAGFPAPHPDFPQVQFLGGAVLANPKFLSISFANDDSAFVDKLDDFTAKLGATSYWAATTSEYGVGAATALPPMHVTDSAVGTLTDDQIQAWLSAHVGTGALLGEPDPNTVYLLWYPAPVTVIEGSASCYAFLAYHYAVAWDGGTDGGPMLAYAVIPRCESVYPDAGPLETATSSAAHELIEAVTDPNPYVQAWGAADEAHVVWNMMLFGETADLCEFDTDSYYTPSDFPYMVQRSWSNAGAMAGLPCVPVATPYFNAMPLLPDSVHYNWYFGSGHTRGLSVAQGQTKTLEIVLFSSEPTAPIHVDITGYPDPSALTFYVPVSEGVNGDVLQLGVTHNFDQPDYGGSPFMITATLGDRVHYYFGFVGD